MRTLAQEAMANRIKRLIGGYPFQIRPWVVSGLYRARVNKPGVLFTSAEQLWYPPTSELVLRPGRLNKPGQIVFYAASMPNTAAIELRVKPGDMMTVLVARTRNGTFETLDTAFIELERSKAPEAEALGPDDNFRTSPDFRKQLGEGNYKKWLLIDDYLNEIFGCAVPDGEGHMYKATIALADLLLKAPGVDAISYPSVATSDHGINVCMLPSRADAIFAASEAWMVEIGEAALHPQTGEHLMRVSFHLRSREIGTDNVINWQPKGVGINEETIRGFTRRRVNQLDHWPLAPANLE